MMLFLRLLVLLGFLAGTRASVAAEFAAPERRPRELLLASLAFAETHWDESAGLLWSPAPGERGQHHRTRESGWYALGLLARNEAGDAARAARIIDRVLAHQFDAPGQRWDGSFRRAPEEPMPPADAQLWKHYDPNWRQFIGTTFVLMLEKFEDRLPPELRERMLAAIRRAVAGELTQGREEPYHTNIALMQGFLWGWAGARLGRGEWVEQSEAWAERIRANFARHQTFEEFNSPTYYGVDFYGLALWRELGATPRVRQLGDEMEAALWRDVAAFYHADLRNLCGPFDRAYGLDLRRYVSLTGIWMGLVLEREFTPLPDPSGPMGHAHDFLVTPAYVLLGAKVPGDVLPAFREFQGERRLERVITSERRASAWIGRDVMLGGEQTSLTREAGPATRYGQFHPATAHWRIGENDVGAFALRVCPPVDARAEPHRLAINTERGEATFRVAAPGLSADALAREQWTLPGLHVRVETDAADFVVTPGEDHVDVTYRAATYFDLRLEHRP